MERFCLELPEVLIILGLYMLQPQTQPLPRHCSRDVEVKKSRSSE